ncbi:proteophosphoglycan PPG1 [Babesia caballi]|uniref:Proteophosphoglycan PPG1 n=1 Tax=Babesia caballi TaxID=5871 RepID=A0AAV4LVB5_BABCB|nr:proteophosphoglycan PPG1 [Babesia caballi]
MPSKSDVSAGSPSGSVKVCPVHGVRRHRKSRSSKNDDPLSEVETTVGMGETMSVESVIDRAEPPQSTLALGPSAADVVPAYEVAESPSRAYPDSCATLFDGGASQVGRLSDQTPAVEEDGWLASWSLKSLLSPTSEEPRGHEGALGNVGFSSTKVVEYKCERMQRIIDVLKAQLVERDDSIAKLMKHVDMLEEWKSELSRGQSLLAAQQNRELGASLAILEEKYNSKCLECQTLKGKLSAMEQDHMLKDGEVRALLVKLNELQLRDEEQSLKLKAALADRGIFATSVQRLRQSFTDQQTEMKLALDKEYQDQVMYLLEQIEGYKKRVEEQRGEVEQRTQLLRKVERECSNLVALIVHQKNSLKARDADLKKMRDAMLDLEEQLFKGEQDSAARISATMAVVESVRKDNADLKIANRELHTELERCMKELAKERAKGLGAASEAFVEAPVKQPLKLTVIK